MSSQFEAALNPVTSALEADGYSLVITEGPGVVRIEISAGPDACEECLSPRQIMEPVIKSLLLEAGLTHGVELKYPTEH